MQKEAEVAEQALNAQIRKQADADKYRQQQQADAQLYQRQRNAEADKFEKQQEAEAKKAQAEAELFARQQEAAGIQAVGEAEAKAIEAKGVAEAEALEKKAEAMKKYGQAAMMEMVVNILPDMAKAIAEPMSSIDNVTIIGGGNDSGMSAISQEVTKNMLMTFETMKAATGFDFTRLLEAKTYEAKVNKNINVSGLDIEKNVRASVDEEIE